MGWAARVGMVGVGPSATMFRRMGHGMVRYSEVWPVRYK